jgi:hypothetical protein
MNATTAVHTARWINLDTGEEHTKEFAHPLDAVQALGQAALHVNTAPLSMDPEPDWSQFKPGGEALGKTVANAQETRAMHWGHYADEWAAQGAGQRWVVVEHADGQGEGTRLFTLQARPLETANSLEDFYRTVKADCTTLEQAQRYALGGVA